MGAINLLGSTMGLGLVSGVNLYATVLTVGLGIRLGLITLRPELRHLEVLASPYILGLAGVIYLIHFFADKIKWVDSLSDALHTFIRPLGAALLGATIIGSVNSDALVAASLCGGVALYGHSTKAGLRLLANHSPEPFSNVVLSLVEDVLVVSGAWLSVNHPVLMLAVVVAFVIAFMWFVPKALRLVRVEFLALFSVIRKFFAWIGQSVFGRGRVLSAADSGAYVATPLSSGGASSGKQSLAVELPLKYAFYLEDKFNLRGDQPRVRCVAGKGITRLKHSIGYLNLTDDSLIFVTRRLFRLRNHTITRREIEDVHFKKQLLLDRLILRMGKKQVSLYFFKDTENNCERVYGLLQVHKRRL